MVPTDEGNDSVSNRNRIQVTTSDQTEQTRVTGLEVVRPVIFSTSKHKIQTQKGPSYRALYIEIRLVVPIGSYL